MKTIQEKNGEVEYVLTSEEYQRLHEANQVMLEALTAISVIKDQLYGPDWEEIGLARRIARAAISKGEQQ